MKISASAIWFAVLLSVASVAAGQTPAPTVTPQNDVDDVVKITTKLVQVDVVVTDKKGNQVRDLGAADFELLQDGKAQKITGVTYVPIDSAQVTNTFTTSGEKPKNGVPPPPAKRGAGEGGRVIALMVDDGSCAASQWGISSARDGIKRFINEQMLPDDMVAIYRTRAGSATFQQYTTDKATLLKAAEKIRWYPGQAGCGNPDGSFSEAAKINTVTVQGADGTKTITAESEAEKKIREYREDSAANNQVVGTLGVLRYALRGLERAPGRKMMFFFSDSLAFRNRQNETQSARVVLRDITDSANRAGVVVNTLFLRGADLFGMIEAKDDVDVKDGSTEPITRSRRDASEKAKEGLSVLAYDTGGNFYQGSDRLNVPMGEILRRESGYYLLAYEPAEGSFKDKKFNQIEVNVKIPDLKVSYRAGYIGVPDAEVVKRKSKSTESDLYDAIASPLPKAGLNIDLSAFFGNSAQTGNYVRSLMHIDGSALLFSDEPNGQKKAVLDVVAVTMNEKNEVIDDFNRTHTLKFDPATAERIARDGLTYSTDVPIKTPGSYTFRVAVRDGNSKQIGSSSQVVQIPDLKRSDIFLSGLSIAGVDEKGNFQKLGPTTAQTAIDLPASSAVPSIRRFKRGSVVTYSYSIYNARLDKTTNQPNITLQVNLYKDGKLVAEGAPSPWKPENQTDLTRINDFGYMRLNQTEAGEYALQLIVRDTLGGKDAVSSQWVDFDVVD
ncbi:MAG: VWA domain-containing protein [Pyrinomonadaceae bacterium]